MALYKNRTMATTAPPQASLLPVRYCCVSHCGRPLVSHQTEPDNYPHMVQQVIRSLDLQPADPGLLRKLTVPIDNFQVHVLCGDHLVYSCVTLRTRQVYQPFCFLKKLRTRFGEMSHLLARAPCAAEHEFDRDFGPVLAGMVFDHNVGRGGNLVMTLQSQIDDVKQVMLENVAKILERGERLEEILAKTGDLEAQSSDFRQSTRQLKASKRCKNLKMWLIIVAILSIVLTVAALFMFGVIQIND